MTAEELESSVILAFPNEAPPWCTRTYHPDGDCEEYYYSGKAWRELDYSFLSPGSAAMLSAETLKFFLPAYLVATLRNEWMPIEGLLDALYTFDIPCSAEYWDKERAWGRFAKWDRFMASLTVSQKHAICKWLIAMRQRGADPEVNELLEVMLANYWVAYAQ